QQPPATPQQSPATTSAAGRKAHRDISEKRRSKRLTRAADAERARFRARKESQQSRMPSIASTARAKQKIARRNNVNTPRRQRAAQPYKCGGGRPRPPGGRGRPPPHNRAPQTSRTARTR